MPCGTGTFEIRICKQIIFKSIAVIKMITNNIAVILHNKITSICIKSACP